MIRSGMLVFAVMALTGCATSQHVTMAQHEVVRQPATGALVPSEGNSPDMDAAIRSSLLAHGVALQPKLPAGTRKSPDVDAIVEYTDIWRWISSCTSTRSP